MLTKLKDAAETGLLWGVRLGVGLLVVGLLLSWLVGDYALTKQRAANGQRAFEFIERGLQQQQQAKPAPPAPK